MMLPVRDLIRALLLGLCLWQSAAAQDLGRVPYAALYERFRPAAVLTQFPRLRGVQSVGSRLDGVRPTQIRIWIQSDDGRIEVPIDERGRASFPLTEALLQENPWVHSNQPQGSLQLQLSLELVLPPGEHLPYSEIWAGIEEAQRALTQLGPDYADGEVVGIEYHFADGPMKVQLDGASLALDLLADEHGRIMLRKDPEWLDGDVQVHFRGRLLAAVPRLR
ncbi:MAG: hypothetical protein KDI37_05205 [Xanthomonadales bacterium]|nr:hypothetical protein [Xanthomonadales bacterium]